VYEGGHGWPLEASAIALILLFNAALGLYQEQRSEAALARLKVLAGAHAWVLRDGEFVRLPTHDLVPGDWARIEAGDRVPADGVLRDPHGVMVDESILTGESVPIDKGPEDEAFSGTLLVRGKTLLEVTRTGALSAMGRLATMLGGIELLKTPLERRVDLLGHRIARWVLVLAASLGVLGIIAEGLSRAPQMIVFAVALAVAAVPEGLPAVLTVALALGVERMARHRAVVRRLSAVEALGSVTVIATDKTGTLTENRMDVHPPDVQVQPRGDESRRVSLHGDWSALPDVSFETYADAATAERVSPRGRCWRYRDSSHRGDLTCCVGPARTGGDSCGVVADRFWWRLRFLGTG
jgi:Ca2+-transporting ATPase